MQNCILFCFVIYDLSNTQNIYNVIAKERSHRQTRWCSIKDCCYRVSHCGLSDSLSVTFNVALIRTGKQKQLGDSVIKLIFLKVILRIIRITLSERVTSFHRLYFVQQKQLDDLWELSSYEHVLYCLY